MGLAWLLWLAAATPGLWQILLLGYTVGARFLYPYDLEWMEGGLLSQADRLAAGQSIYPPPSIDFIPYLYTPLYPALLAVLTAVFDLSYQLGRIVSIVSLIAIAAMMMRVIVMHGVAHGVVHDHRSSQAPTVPLPLRIAAAASAVGLMAAGYPWFDGWYDIVRADTLFVAMMLAGLLLLQFCAKRRYRRPLNAHGAIAGAAAFLALSFFCKQTGVIYVAVGGALLLLWNWRYVPVYVCVAGLVGLGGTALANDLTQGWFWTYIFEVHQAHDFNIDRFYLSFYHILLQFPALTVAVVLGLLMTAATWLYCRTLPAAARALGTWSLVFAVSCIVGALGWATQWAHFNAYMPALITGAIAAGLAIPACYACVTCWQKRRAAARQRQTTPDKTTATPIATTTATIVGFLAAAALGGQLIMATWTPSRYIPTEADVAAGDELISTLRALRAQASQSNGNDEAADIYVPYHPWYARLAGQRPLYSHRMGLMDLGYDNQWSVAGLQEAFSEHRFRAIVLDNRPPGWEFANLRQHYRVERHLPRTARPRVFTGANVVPDTVWVPIETRPPKGSRIVFDFETNRMDKWTFEGKAWGRRPVTGPLRKQGRVTGYRGRRYLTSMHGGDRSTGTLSSPAFTLDGQRLTLLLSGGSDRERLRVELHLVPPTDAAGDEAPQPDNHIIHSAGNRNDSEAMQQISWNIGQYRGARARLVFIDESSDAWGHLNVDQVLIWQ